MTMLGKRSGFRTARDVALFVVGGIIVAVHLASTYRTPEAISTPLVVAATGLMASPAILKRDESKTDDDE